MRSIIFSQFKCKYHHVIVRYAYQKELQSRCCRPIIDTPNTNRCPILIDTDVRQRWSSSSTDDKNGGQHPSPIVLTEISPVRKNTRQRHRFNNSKNKSISMDDIPSFHDFQRVMQIRTLYRQYTRLIGLYHRKRSNNVSSNTNGTSITTATPISTATLSPQQQLELQTQVRTEFKHHQNTNHQNDIFYIQKSLAEGQRRYKELCLMIHGTTNASTSSTEITSPLSPTIHHNTATSTAPSTSLSSSSSSSSPPTATEMYWPWNKVTSNTHSPTPSDHSFPLKFPPKSKS